MSKAKPSANTIWTDRFYQGQPVSPERPVKKSDFFKQCDLVRRSPYPSRSEWECDE